MPLPHAAARKAIHTRTFDCRGYEREDGLWDIEGHLVDTKAFHWRRTEGLTDLPAGEPVHDMWIRLTIDLDMKIHDAVALTDAGPYRACGDITPNFAALKGHTIQRGWTRGLRTRIGGVHGCAHLWELLGRVAAVAYQSTGAARAIHRPLPKDRIPYQFMNCHMYTPHTHATLERWPHLYKGPKASTDVASQPSTDAASQPSVDVASSA
ncbi:MAG: DUF2889 domain-containing protein [Burkholderiales bacterium]|nr:DUF2889 domain-containing protein [Burkholderiales bacterium]